VGWVELGVNLMGWVGLTKNGPMSMSGSNVQAREYESREVAQSQIYVIVTSFLEVSFCTQPFPTPSGGLW